MAEPNMIITVNATPNLNKALVLVQSEIGIIPFDKINPHFKSPFSSLTAIVSTCRPVLSKHGLSISHSIVGMILFTRLKHISGEEIECQIPLILSKQDMQGMGSAITYAKRYGISAILNLVTDDDDDGNEACTTPPRANPLAPKTINNPLGKSPAIPKPITQVKAKEPDTSFNFGHNMSPFVEKDVP